MRKHLYSLITALGFCLAVILVFGTSVSLAAPSQDPMASIDRVPEYSIDGVTTIAARAAISIPTVLLFGFEPPLELSDDGRTLAVNGHATCPEGGETFRLMVIISQDSSGARALGRTIEHCTGERQRWSADVDTLGPAWRTFEPGSAQACAMALISAPRGRTVTGSWCADVDVVLR